MAGSAACRNSGSVRPLAGKPPQGLQFTGYSLEAKHWLNHKLCVPPTTWKYELKEALATTFGGACHNHVKKKIKLGGASCRTFPNMPGRGPPSDYITNGPPSPCAIASTTGNLPIQFRSEICASDSFWSESRWNQGAELLWFSRCPAPLC